MQSVFSAGQLQCSQNDSVKHSVLVIEYGWQGRGGITVCLIDVMDYVIIIKYY